MAATKRPIAAFVLVVGCCLVDSSSGAQYLGKFLGKLNEFHHGVAGEVYAVDGRTLHIKDFSYDGQAPKAFFLAGSSRTPGKDGFKVPDQNGNSALLRRYRKEPVTITLPEGKTLRDIKWFSIWCEEYEVNFGDVKIPRSFDYPRPQKIDPLKGVHGISSDNVVVVDAQTLLVPNLSYDGEAPDAKFWVGRGPKPSPQGIRVPDENGKELPLRRYDRKTVVLTLPGDLTVFEIGHFGIWCEAFTVDFGHIQLPQNLNVPPSLKMLGVSPQKRLHILDNIQNIEQPRQRLVGSKLNCEVLRDDLAFEIRWAVAGDSIVMQLVAKLDQREYMSFGISGELEKSAMVGGDVVVAWVDKETLKGYAVDYYLDAKSQCSGPKGSCPDENIQPATNSIRLLNAAMVNGYSIVTYQRPLRASDELDKQIFTNRSQAIIWGIGPLNQKDEVSFHTYYTKGNRFIDFGRPSKWNCPMPETDTSASMKAALENAPVETVRSTTTEVPTVRSRNSERKRGDSRGTRRPQQQQQQQQPEAVKDSVDSASQPARSRQQSGRRGVSTTTAKPVPSPAPVRDRDAWEIPAIQCYEPEDGVFYAQMGPTGGKRGYPAITGHVGWGISWYINGLLIPEIYLVRGKTYTFVVEGGLDPDVPAKYHPFYITDDPIGGYEYKTDEEKQNVKIFAGVRKTKDGKAYPTGVGRLCHWTHQGNSDADDYPSFGAYQRTLELKCDQGEPGVIQWTPDANTPDTVYYQCYTHRYLGWKIHIVDSCDGQAAASELQPVVVRPDDSFEEKDELTAGDSDLEESPSIIVETRVKPNGIPDFSKKVITEEQETTTEKKRKQNWLQSSGQDAANADYTNFADQVLDNMKSELILNLDEAQEEVSITTTTTTTTAKPVTKNKAESTKPLNKQDTLDLTVMNLPQKESFSYGKIMIRRPTLPVPLVMQNKPHILQQPSKTMLRPLNMMHPRPFQLKKPYYSRPVYKTSVLTRPVRMPQPIIEEKPVFMQNVIKSYSHRPQTVILMKPHGLPLNEFLLVKQAPQQFIRASTERPRTEDASQVTPTTPTITNIEISPQQASTEKEPDLENSKPYAPLLSIKPSLTTYKLPPARNTGFRPESVVIEGGFKPIVSKDMQDRKDEAVEEGPEIENESEIGVINVSTEKDMDKSPAVVESFEPVFVPSPLDKFTQQKPTKMRKRANIKKNQMLFIIKTSRSVNDDEALSDDEIAEAAERVDSYYLPPSDKELKHSQVAFKPSDIDISPGTVVTYDGKKVSSSSLTMKYPERATALESRVSKAAELIKSSPQFVPFKGDLPPLDPRFVNTDVPQLKSRGGLSRDLDAPLAPTRLSLVRHLEENVERRKRREAHHTPEHTAEQNLARQKQEEAAKSSTSRIKGISFSALLLICLVTLL